MINKMIIAATGSAKGDYGCMLRAYCRRHIIDAMLQVTSAAPLFYSGKIPLPVKRLRLMLNTQNVSSDSKLQFPQTDQSDV